MKSRKLLAMLLAASMVASFASCNASEETTTSSEDTASNSSSETSTTSTEPAKTSTDSGVLAATTGVTAEDILARDYSEPITISFAGIQCTDGFDYTHGNEYYDWWSDTFNIEWDVISLSFDTWVERLNTWINADDLPDWSVWNFTPGDAANYAEQGLVYEMPENWKTEYPNLAAAATCSEANAHYEELYGGMYYFFRPTFANNFPADLITNHMSLMIRTDWAEQAGFTLSGLDTRTISESEFFDYCRAVKDAGITDVPWYTTSGGIGTLLGKVAEANGTMESAYYKADDGMYHWGPAEEETGIKEGLRKIKQAYDEGLIYQEFYTMQSPDDAGHFYAAGDGAAVVIEGMASTFDNFAVEMQNNLNLDFWEVASPMIITDDNGVAQDTPSTNYWGVNILSPNIDEATYERIMSIWDYGCTEEGQLRIRLGLPDVDWTYDENGEVVSLLDGGYAALTEKYTTMSPITGNMFILSDDYSFINPSISKEARDLVSDLYIERAKIASTIGEEPDWDLLSYSSQAMNLASMTYADEYANIITKSGDFDANYDQWVSDKMAMIQPVLDELNAAFSE